MGLGLDFIGFFVGTALAITSLDGGKKDR